MAELSEATIAELKAKHGDLQQLEAKIGGSGDEVSVVVRRLSQAEFQKIQAMATNDNPQVKATAARTILEMAAVYPAGPELDALVRQYPGLPDSLGGEILAIAGAGVKVSAKKL